MSVYSFIFFFKTTANSEIYTLSLHDALPILNKKEIYQDRENETRKLLSWFHQACRSKCLCTRSCIDIRSEEHTSELQSRGHLVCRLLLEKKKKHINGKYSSPFDGRSTGRHQY